MFEVSPVLDDEFVLLAQGAVAQHAGKITPSALARLPLILYESGANTCVLIDQWAMRVGISLKPVMELGSVEAIKEVVGAGLGCGVIPHMPLRRASMHRGVVMRSLSPKLHRKLAIVLRHDKPLQRSLREVVKAINVFARDFMPK